METNHNVVLIPVEKIDSNPFQPRRAIAPELRDELRDSIATRGLLEAIGVRAVEDRYQVIFGHQRLDAFRTLSKDEQSDEATRSKFAQIPACIRENVSDATMLELALTENIQRNALTPLEIGDGLAMLQKLNPNLNSIRGVGGACGLRKSKAASFLELAEAPGCLREHLENQSLPVKTVQELIRCHRELKATQGIPNAEAFATKRVGHIAKMARDQKWTAERTRRHVDRVLSGDFKGGEKKQSLVESPRSVVERADKAPAPEVTAHDAIVGAAVTHWSTTLFEAAWAPYRYVIWFAGLIIHAFSNVVLMGHAVRRKLREEAIKARSTARATSVAVPAKKPESLPVSTPKVAEAESKKAA